MAKLNAKGSRDGANNRRITATQAHSEISPISATLLTLLQLIISECSFYPSNSRLPGWYVSDHLPPSVKDQYRCGRYYFWYTSYDRAHPKRYRIPASYHHRLLPYGLYQSVIPAYVNGFSQDLIKLLTILANKITDLIKLNVDKVLKLVSLIESDSELEIQAAIFKAADPVEVNGLSKSIYYRLFVRVYSVVNLFTMHLFRRQSTLLINLLNKANKDGHFWTPVANNPYGLEDMAINCKDAAFATYFNAHMIPGIWQNIAHHPTMDFLDILDCPFKFNRSPVVKKFDGLRAITHPIWVASGHCFLPIPSGDSPAYSRSTHLLVRFDGSKYVKTGGYRSWLKTDSNWYIPQYVPNLISVPNPEVENFRRYLCHVLNPKLIGLEYKEFEPNYVTLCKTVGNIVYTNVGEVGHIFSDKPDILPMSYLKSFLLSDDFGHFGHTYLVDIGPNTYIVQGSDNAKIFICVLDLNPLPPSRGYSSIGTRDISADNLMYLPYTVQFNNHSIPLLDYSHITDYCPGNALEAPLGCVRVLGSLKYSYKNLHFNVAKFPASLLDNNGFFSLQLDLPNGSLVTYAGFEYLHNKHVQGCKILYIAGCPPRSCSPVRIQQLIRPFPNLEPVKITYSVSAVFQKHWTVSSGNFVIDYNWSHHGDIIEVLNDFYLTYQTSDLTPQLEMTHHTIPKDLSPMDYCRELTHFITTPDYHGHVRLPDWPLVFKGLCTRGRCSYHAVPQGLVSCQEWNALMMCDTICRQTAGTHFVENHSNFHNAFSGKINNCEIELSEEEYSWKPISYLDVHEKTRLSSAVCIDDTLKNSLLWPTHYFRDSDTISFINCPYIFPKDILPLFTCEESTFVNCIKSQMNGIILIQPPISWIQWPFTDSDGVRCWHTPEGDKRMSLIPVSPVADNIVGMEDITVAKPKVVKSEGALQEIRVPASFTKLSAWQLFEKRPTKKNQFIVNIKDFKYRFGRVSYVVVDKNPAPYSGLSDREKKAVAKRLEKEKEAKELALVKAANIKLIEDKRLEESLLLIKETKRGEIIDDPDFGDDIIARNNSDKIETISGELPSDMVSSVIISEKPLTRAEKKKKMHEARMLQKAESKKKDAKYKSLAKAIVNDMVEDEVVPPAINVVPVSLNESSTIYSLPPIITDDDDDVFSDSEEDTVQITEVKPSGILSRDVAQVDEIMKTAVQPELALKPFRRASSPKQIQALKPVQAPLPRPPVSKYVPESSNSGYDKKPWHDNFKRQMNISGYNSFTSWPEFNLALDRQKQIISLQSSGAYDLFNQEVKSGKLGPGSEYARNNALFTATYYSQPITAYPSGAYSVFAHPNKIKIFFNVLGLSMGTNLKPNTTKTTGFRSELPPELQPLLTSDKAWCALGAVINSATNLAEQNKIINNAALYSNELNLMHSDRGLPISSVMKLLRPNTSYYIVDATQKVLLFFGSKSTTTPVGFYYTAGHVENIILDKFKIMQMVMCLQFATHKMVNSVDYAGVRDPVNSINAMGFDAGLTHDERVEAVVNMGGTTLYSAMYNNFEWSDVEIQSWRKQAVNMIAECNQFCQRRNLDFSCDALVNTYVIKHFPGGKKADHYFPDIRATMKQLLKSPRTILTTDRVDGYKMTQDYQNRIKYNPFNCVFFEHPDINYAFGLIYWGRLLNTYLDGLPNIAITSPIPNSDRFAYHPKPTSGKPPKLNKSPSSQKPSTPAPRPCPQNPKNNTNDAASVAESNARAGDYDKINEDNGYSTESATGKLSSGDLENLFSEAQSSLSDVEPYINRNEDGDFVPPEMENWRGYVSVKLPIGPWPDKPLGDHLDAMDEKTYKRAKDSLNYAKQALENLQELLEPGITNYRIGGRQIIVTQKQRNLAYRLSNSIFPNFSWCKENAVAVSFEIQDDCEIWFTNKDMRPAGVKNASDYLRCGVTATIKMMMQTGHYYDLTHVFSPHNFRPLDSNETQEISYKVDLVYFYDLYRAKAKTNMTSEEMRAYITALNGLNGVRYGGVQPVHLATVQLVEHAMVLRSNAITNGRLFQAAQSVRQPVGLS